MAPCEHCHKQFKETDIAVVFKGKVVHVKCYEFLAKKLHPSQSKDDLVN